MKRDPLPAQPEVKHRNPRGSVPCTMLLLRKRELTRVQLAEQLQERFPLQTLHMDQLVEHLVGKGHMVEDGAGLLGLTDTGDKFADTLHPSWLNKPTVAAQRQERRVAALANANEDPNLLTRSPHRGGASAADLATPPQRPGGDDHLHPPSRIGDRLHYRNGRVTTMDGTEVQPARSAEDYRPSRSGRNADDRRAFRERLFAN